MSRGRFVAWHDIVMACHGVVVDVYSVITTTIIIIIGAITTTD
jgi:hypothetical protein